MANFDFQQSAPTIQELLNSIPGKAEQTEVEQLQSDVETLRALYEALQQSAPVIIQPSDTWPVASPEEGVIYRVIDRINTPPQYYSDYMWNGITMVQMAQYNNGIDDEPTALSNNLAKSGGINKSIYNTKYEIISSGNLYTGIEYDGYYLDWGTGEHVSYPSFGISYEIPVSEGDVITFNEHHSILFYDASHAYIHKCFIVDDPNTIVVPEGSVYMRCNINKEWTDGIVINRGDAANDPYEHKEQIREELLPEGLDVYIPSQDETTQTIFNNVSAIGKKVILLMKNRVIIDNYYLTMPNNLYKVIGLGGVFIPYNPQEGQVFNLTFPNECIFECGHYQLFHKQVRCICSNGFLLGEPNALWWGAAIDRVTDDQVPVDSMMASSFMVIRFIAGNYRAYVENKISGRTLIFEPGAVIDGVVHIAYGDYTNKVYCKDTNVIGQVVSTCRVGGSYIDGLYIPNGIKILKTDQIWYNQNKTDAGTAGVHFNISNKNINIGHIEVEEVVDRTTGGGQQYIWAYGLCIDRGDGNEGHEAPHDIYIESLNIQENKSAFFDVALVTCNNIKIGRITCGDGNRKINSLLLADVHDILIDSYKETSSNTSNSASHVNGDSVHDVKIGKLSMSGAGKGMVLNQSADITVDDFYAENLTEGLSVTSCNRVFIERFRTLDCTTDIVNSGSTLDIIKNYNS